MAPARIAWQADARILGETLRSAMSRTIGDDQGLHTSRTRACSVSAMSQRVAAATVLRYAPIAGHHQDGRGRFPNRSSLCNVAAAQCRCRRHCVHACRGTWFPARRCWQNANPDGVDGVSASMIIASDNSICAGCSGCGVHGAGLRRRHVPAGRGDCPAVHRILPVCIDQPIPAAGSFFIQSSSRP